MIVKRLFDLVVSCIGLAVFAPLLLAIAFWIRLDSSGPIFFRQERVGWRGRLFQIHKFRTMRPASTSAALQITVGNDSRITKAGEVLRRYKLDELPQLIDVLAGHMSLVGPRPEVPKYMARYPHEIREKVLSVRPGITDWASVQFRDESTLLANAADPERVYLEEILPIKQRYYLTYVDSRSFVMDLKIIWATLVVSLRG